MPIEDIFKRLENVKRIVNPINYEKLSMSDLVSLIMKEEKSTEEKEMIRKVYKYISNIRESVQNLGQKILELYEECDEEYTDILIYEKNNLEGHTKDIIYFLDQFIDSISALNKTNILIESKYELVKIELFLRSNRDIILKRANSYRKEKTFRSYTDSDEIVASYKNFLEDIIDIVIREAMKLSVIKFYDRIKVYVDVEDKQ